jgi:hypothetical protein
MLEFYKKTYYHIYCFFLKIDNEDPEFTASALLSLSESLMIFNFVSFSGLLGFDMAKSGSVYIYALLSYAPFVILNYFLFVYKNKAEVIKKTYDRFYQERKKLNVSYTLLVILIPLVILILLIYLNRIKLYGNNA